MKPSKILEEAFKLIDAPEKWSRSWLAISQDGKGVYFASEKAALFTPQGAILRFLGEGSEREEGRLVTISLLWQAIPHRDVSPVPELGVYQYNMEIHPDHAKLKAWFDKAIELAGEYENEAIRDPSQSVGPAVQPGGMVA